MMHWLNIMKISLYFIMLLFFKLQNCFGLIHFNALHFNQYIVKEMTDYLPKVDLVGHNVLLSNENLIPKILELQSDGFITDDVKKNLILGIIKFSQVGDQFGNIVIQNYYDIVERLL